MNGQVARDSDVSDEAFRLLIENVKDYGIFMLDAEGRVITWNEGAERLLGYTADEVIGQSFVKIFTTHDVEKEQPEFELRQAAEKGRAEDERWHVRKDGSQFWASGVVTPLWNEDGRLRGFAKIVRDITERKQAELSLADANRRKDEFLAMLSHELRNPLGAILSAIELARLESTCAPTIKQSLSVIERQADGLVRLTEDLSDVTRINQGKTQLCRERISLQTVIEHALETVKPIITARGHVLSVTLASATIWVEADSHRLEQVFVNLLSNAAKYTDAGGHIYVSLLREGNQAVIKVKDDGAGIVSEMLPRIFELFVQADRSLDRAQGGLGIGLTLVKGLVEMHGGKVEAFSEGAGHGSEFVVRLPVVPEVMSLESKPDPKAHQSECRKLRILIADDNVDTAQGLAMILQKHGHEVFVAYRGTEALQVALEKDPDVVLLDIGLPGMSGHRVAQTLRQQRPKEMQLIAMTGYGQEEDRQHSKQAGFDHHLVKPVKFSQLLDLLGEQIVQPPVT